MSNARPDQVEMLKTALLGASLLLSQMSDLGTLVALGCEGAQPERLPAWTASAFDVFAKAARAGAEEIHEVVKAAGL